MKRTTRIDYEDRIQQVLLYIRQNLYGDLSLRKLASVAYFSEYHFHRVFRGMTGETLADHIRRLRLERSAWKLKLSDESVTELAFEAGYDNVESYIRAFKNIYRVPPTEFRARKIEKWQTVRVPRKLSKGDNIMIEAKIEKLEPRKVAYVRHTGPYAECHTAWKTLCSWAWPKGLLKGVKPIGLSYDDPEITPPDKIRYDACIPVKGSVKPESGISIQEIAGGEYAVTVHKGPFEKLSETYLKLCGEWLPKTGRKTKNLPSVEIYLNDIRRTKPENIRVEIQIPLE